jgi:hypothetical protein
MKRIASIFLAMGFLFAGMVLAESQNIDLNYGTLAYLEITDANQTGLDIAGDLTIETWVKIKGDISAGQTICSKYSTMSSGSFYWAMNGSNGVVVFCYFNQAGNYTSFESSAPLINLPGEIGKWVHIAITVNVSSKIAKVYKNGVLNGTLTTYDTGASSIKNSSDPFRISCYGSSNNNPLCGSVKNFRIWNVVRTAEEIAYNYNREVLATTSGLAGYWKFNGNANDATANNNHLTAHGTVSYETSPDSLLTPGTASNGYLHFAPVPDMNSNNFPEIAGLFVSSAGMPTVSIVDGYNGQSLGQIQFFNVQWTPKKVIVFDINNDNNLDISVLASKGDSTKVESRKISDGSWVKTIILP